MLEPSWYISFWLAISIGMLIHGPNSLIPKLFRFFLRDFLSLRCGDYPTLSWIFEFILLFIQLEIYYWKCVPFPSHFFQLFHAELINWIDYVRHLEVALCDSEEYRILQLFLAHASSVVCVLLVLLHVFDSARKVGKKD